MKVYRLSKKKYAGTAWTGEGSNLVAGRWHEKGTRMVYCSETASLAVLEVLVHLQQLLTLPYSLLRATIADKDIIDVQDFKKLHAIHKNETAQTVGELFIAKNTHLALRVANVLSDVESNVLLNPNHPRINTVSKRAAAKDYVFDVRLWKGD